MPGTAAPHTSPSSRRTRPPGPRRAGGSRGVGAAGRGRSSPDGSAAERRLPERAAPVRAAPPRGGARPRSPASFERALDLPVGVALGEVAALVAYLLAARDGDLDLDAPVLEVHARRHERQALLADRAV